MNNELLGTQIAKYRKAAGITQEELGKAVGVSTQAVSRWECGGAPDVSLLPAIADKLGVTIDTLFGRSEGAARDIYGTFVSWLAAMPVSRRMDQVFRLMVSTQSLFYGEFEPTFAPEEYPRMVISSSYTADRHDLLRSAYELAEGIALGVPGEDCPFCLLMPEPAGGYEANLFPPEDYRALFELLGKPGALDILYYLHRKTGGYFTVHALAKQAKLEPEAAASLLETMAGKNLLATQTIETERGVEPIYALSTDSGFIPFLFLARWIMDPSNSWRGIWHNRAKPLLSAEGPLGEKRDQI